MKKSVPAKLSLKKQKPIGIVSDGADQLTVKKLTPKESLFVKEYLVDLNASQACIRAGYVTKQPDVLGYQLKVKLRIAEAIDKAMSARAEKIGYTAEDVIRDIDLIKENAMRIDEVGNMADLSAALKACELKGRHRKMFTDKVEATGKDGEKLFNNIFVVAGK